MTRQKKHGAISLINFFSFIPALSAAPLAGATPQEFRKKIEAEQLSRTRQMDQQIRADSSLSNKDREILNKAKPSATEDVRRENELIAAELKSIETKKQIESPKVRPANAPKPKKPSVVTGAAGTGERPEKPSPPPKGPETPENTTSPATAPETKAVSGEAMPEIVYPGK
jgi:hypothetical protein